MVMIDGNVVREGQPMAELWMELETFYIEFLDTDGEQCGDGRWLAKTRPSRIELNSPSRIRTKAIQKIKYRN